MRLLFGLLAAALLWDVSGWDLAVSRGFGDAAGFAARDAFWARALMHDGLRLVFALLFLVALVQAWQAGRSSRPGPTRADHGRALVALVLAWLLVPLLKQGSFTSCPWSLAEFGGEAHRVSHWLAHRWSGLGDGGPGHCFPAGHSTGGFAFFALLMLWAPWRTERPWAWRFWCVVPWVGGGLSSFAQVARGAHFVSHCLWAATLCALIAFVFKPRRTASPPGRPSPDPA